jgi:hypothetical protein
VGTRRRACEEISITAPQNVGWQNNYDCSNKYPTEDVNISSMSCNSYMTMIVSIVLISADLESAGHVKRARV